MPCSEERFSDCGLQAGYKVMEDTGHSPWNALGLISGRKAVFCQEFYLSQQAGICHHGGLQALGSLIGIKIAFCSVIYAT